MDMWQKLTNVYSHFNNIIQYSVSSSKQDIQKKIDPENLIQSNIFEEEEETKALEFEVKKGCKS